MAGENEVDDDFASGFNDNTPAPTTTPEAKVEPAEPAAEITAAEPEVATPEPEPEYAKITKADYDALVARAASIDEIRAETKRQFDTAFGRLGNQQQLLERLQSTTQAGQQVSVTPADFEELVAEGYTDLASMQAAGLNRILSKIQLRGTAPAGEMFDPAKVRELLSQHSVAERAAVKQELREELAHDALTEMHEDWRSVVNTPEFGEFAKTNKVFEQKDRAGASFAESIDAKFVGGYITKFKEARKLASARQDRLAASVTPRGSGGLAAASSSDDDEFLKGFKS